jgi:superfamily II DNA/RNA helicase
MRLRRPCRLAAAPWNTDNLIETIPLPEIMTAPADPSAHADAAATESPTTQTPPVAVDAAPEAVVADAAPDSVVTAAESAAPVQTAEEASQAADDAEARAAWDEEPEAPGFASLGLSDAIVKAVTEKGYTTPTPIQAQAIPTVLMGRDVLGCAQTGTGKTASFTLPMMDILSGSRARARMPRSLILEPTRELALQVAENFIEYGKYMKLTHALVIGGESMSDQKDLLMRGVDVLIATPGRLIDMFDRGSMLLTDTRLLVIDEADRMLDMGFIPDVERIVSLLPKNRQTLFFSATMAPEIRRLADAFLQNPKEITVSKPASVATTITEGLVMVPELEKREALRRLIRSEDVQSALIFCNRKKDVDILFKSLSKHKFSVGALHGDMAQSVRFSTLEKFKAGEIRLLCCSDVAARGIDIGGLSHVFNFDAPHHAEDYVHRIGRTGRAGREGHAFTFATPDDKMIVDAIEKLIGHPIPRITIEGLETVDWAAGDGRRRGRGGRAAPRSSAPKAETASVAKEPGEAPKRTRTRKPRAAAPVGEIETVAAPEVEAMADSVAETMVEAVAAPRVDREPRRDDRTRNTSKRDEPRRDEPRRDDSRRHEPRRDEGRRSRGRDDDLGPSVLGFGDDVPAFMLVAARPNRAAVMDSAADASEDADT